MKKQTNKYPCPDGVHSLEEEGRWTLNRRCMREEIIGWKEISAPRRENAARKLRLGVLGGGEMVTTEWPGNLGCSHFSQKHPVEL